MTDDPVIAAAARLVGGHQRRHPTVNGCCCGWQGGPTMGWREHVARELAAEGLLARQVALTGPVRR